MIEPPIVETRMSVTVEGLIPQELSHLKLNRSLLMHLDSVYHYKNDKSLQGNIDIQKSFCDDVSYNDILRWFWPNYKSLAIILSLREGHNDIAGLFDCFQKFLVSFTCFHCKQSSFLVDVMLTKFVKNDLITVRERVPKSMAKFVPSGSNFHQSFKIVRLCELHFDTLRQILKLKLRVQEPCVVLIVFNKICLVLESLVHVLLAHRGSSKASRSIAISAQSAFKTRYLNRTHNMSHKYANELSDSLSKRTGSIQEKTELIRIIVLELLELIHKVHWPDHHMKPKEAQTCRLNVQSTLLVSGDLDLIAKFRLTHWPAWSIHCE